MAEDKSRYIGINPVERQPYKRKGTMKGYSGLKVKIDLAYKMLTTALEKVEIPEESRTMIDFAVDLLKPPKQTKDDEDE